MKYIFLIAILALSCKQNTLFADESYIDTSLTYNIGYTYNDEIASILQKRGAKIIKKDKAYKFILNKKKSYYICIDPDHKMCDSKCECDGLDCEPLNN